MFASVTAGLLGAAGPAAAAVIASNTFSTGAEGWTNGDFDQLGTTSALVYDAETTDGATARWR